MNWAPRVKAPRLRRLYRSFRAGLPDEDILEDIGWSLYQRAEDVVTVAVALHLGEVPCPECSTPVMRLGYPKPTAPMRAHLFRNRQRSGWFHCEHCQKRLLWQDCRDELRSTPRCFDCDRILRRRGDRLSCACGKAWTREQYRASVSRRVLLPCPGCRNVIRRPDHTDDTVDETIPDSTPIAYECTRCDDGLFEREGPSLVCRACGHQVSWRSFKKTRKRRPEALQCGDCGHHFDWQSWRKRALDYSTGNPEPALRFVEGWNAGGTPQQRMMHVDLLVQALHGQGALAPVFIEGTKQSIRQLLDELNEAS